MKTRTFLMFTASVATISSASTADSDDIQAFGDNGPSVVATAAALPEAMQFQTAPAAMKTSQLELAVHEIASAVTPVEVVAVAPTVSVEAPLAPALVVEAVAIPAAVEVALPAAAVIVADIVPLATMPAPVASVEAAAVEVAPVIDADSALAASSPATLETDIVAPAAATVIVPVETATPAKASVTALQQADAVAVPEMASPAALAEAGSVKVPDAPSYAFYTDTSAAAAPAVAIQAGAMDYSGTVTLEQAIAAALETSPEINQAIMNKEAIEFEREQAQGLYMPRVNLEASAGIRRLENPTRRTLGIEDDALYPLEAGINAEQTILDFGRRHGELMRQAARTDGAALRVAERSENTALLVSRQYLDILLQQRIVAAADDNVTFHRNLVGDLGQGVTQGSISIADQQQAQERLQAAIVRKTEAEEALINAQIALQTLTGLTIGGAAMPQSLKAALSPTLGEAVAEARQNNPKVKEASADVDAAHAMVEKANGDLFPTLGVEARGRVGEDIDGFDGETNDVMARVVLRWNIFDGGINRAKVQEMVRRSSEARFRLHELGRFAEEDVRRAWNSMSTQRKIEGELETQSRVSDDLLLSYREQFNVGRRSLLDVLDAQNTRYNVQVRLETARFSEQFAEYQVLAATNKLLSTMSLATPAGATSDARGRFDYGPPPPAELQRRRYPR
jgi:outer membrane protein, adhesin transport system